MNGKHKLLLTSRPYAVGKKKDIADLVVHHKGLSPRQVRYFASQLLLQKGAPLGVCDGFIAVLDKVVHLGQLACVPVNLRSLLWMWH